MTDIISSQDQIITARLVDLTKKFKHDVCQVVGVAFYETAEDESCMEFAKDICRSLGHDPEDIVMGFPGSHQAMHAKGLRAFVDIPYPLWWWYLPEARAARSYEDGAFSKAPMIDFINTIAKAQY